MLNEDSKKIDKSADNKEEIVDFNENQSVSSNCKNVCRICLFDSNEADNMLITPC